MTTLQHSFPPLLSRALSIHIRLSPLADRRAFYFRVHSRALNKEARQNVTIELCKHVIDMDLYTTVNSVILYLMFFFTRTPVNENVAYTTSRSRHGGRRRSPERPLSGGSVRA
jgi:hypothetical protein